MQFRHVFLASALIAASGCATKSNPASGNPSLVAFVGATVVSLDSSISDRKDTVIVVRGDRILTIGDTEDIPAGAVQIDVSDLYALPGIIDTHVHVATPPNREQAELDLSGMLHAGITTARSMADDVRSAAELSRRAYVHDIESPDIIYAAVFAGPTFMNDPRVNAVTAGLPAGDIPWMRRIDGDTDLPDVVMQARGSGASGIKIYADLTGPQVAEISEEARAQNIPIWAHTAVYPAGPDAVAVAGVTTMSHACSLAHTMQSATPVSYHTRDPMPDRNKSAPLAPKLVATFTAMRDNGTILDATAKIYDWYGQTSEKPQLCSGALSADMTRLAIEHGVLVSTGTDFKTETGPAAIHLEMQYLNEAVGMSLNDVWIAATQTGAKVVGAEDELGRIAPNYLANLLFYPNDPTEDFDALEELHMVVKRGRVTMIE